MNLSDLCQCGHAREEHACPTHRGVCSACYGASDHGQNEYCGRFRRASEKLAPFLDERCAAPAELRNAALRVVAAGAPEAYKSDKP